MRLRTETFELSNLVEKRLGIAGGPTLVAQAVIGGSRPATGSPAGSHGLGLIRSIEISNQLMNSVCKPGSDDPIPEIGRTFAAAFPGLSRAFPGTFPGTFPGMAFAFMGCVAKV
jgi:hypothetical protein